MAFFDNLSDGLSGGAQGAAAGGMVGGVPGALIGGGVGALGGIIAGESTRKRAKAEADRINAENEARILAQLKALEGYNPKDYYRDEQYIGDIYAPDLPSASRLGTGMEGVRLDPSLIAAQSQSLSSLGDVIGQGGMTLQDRANFQDANAAAQRQASRQQAAMQDQMAARGLAGSGNETVARMMAAQGAADASARSARDMNAMAQKRALEAIMSRGTLAGNMADQDFGRQTKIAQAKDIINQFNETNRLRQGNTAAEMQMDAAKSNRDVKQGVEGRNVRGLSELGSQVYKKASGIADIQGGRPVSATPNVPNPMQMFQQGIGSIGAGIQGYQGYQDRTDSKARQDKYDKWAEEDRFRRNNPNVYDYTPSPGNKGIG
jgi:hypothetical protein